MVESELLVPMYCLKLLPVAWQEDKLLGAAAHPADRIDATSEDRSIRVKGFRMKQILNLNTSSAKLNSNGFLTSSFQCMSRVNHQFH